MNGTTVFLTAIGYVSFLFLIARWGDSAGRRFASGRSRAVVYAFSLAVYCTSWTYYGSVGLASEHGLDFLAIYVGPILVIGLGAPFIARVANLARAQNVTTVADFVSARYGKSQPGDSEDFVAERVASRQVCGHARFVGGPRLTPAR
jgi:Na+/proline symporter